MAPNAFAQEAVARMDGSASSDDAIDDQAIVLFSPLDAIPTVEHGARRVLLAPPSYDVPDDMTMPDGVLKGRITFLVPFKDGLLSGTDAGEWGGLLRFTSPVQDIVLARQNVVTAFTWQGSFYVVSGLNHMGIEHGELLNVDLDALKVTRRVPLPGAPIDVLVTNHSRLVIRTQLGSVALLPDGEVVSVEEAKPTLD